MASTATGADWRGCSHNQLYMNKEHEEVLFGNICQKCRWKDAISSKHWYIVLELDR